MTSGKLNSLTKKQTDYFANLAKDERIIRLCAALGDDANLHLVGGTVRDVFLGLCPHDLDCACALAPEEIRARLERRGIHTIPTGLKHQTVTTLPVAEMAQVEITSFRSSQMSPSGGVALGASIEEDLSYRDFTMNALAFDLSAAKLIDICDGLADLSNRLIRAVGKPSERFREDPLRVMRMVRFGCAEGFVIDSLTLTAASDFINAVSVVSPERIRDELTKILISPHPDRGFRLLHQIGILGALLPEIDCCFEFEQNKFHKADVFEHTLEVVRTTSPDLELRLAALLHDIGKVPTLSIDQNGERHFYLHEKVGAEMSEVLLKRLRYPNAIIDSVVTLVRTHMRPIEAGAGGLRRLLRDTGEKFPKWRELKEADARACKMDDEELSSRLRNFDAAIEEVKKGPQVSPLSSLAISGSDLLETGLRPGPLIGQILRALHEEVLDNPALNTREELINRIPQVLELLESRAEVKDS